MLAIFFAMKSFVHEVSNKHVKILSDSMTAVSYVNNFGGIKSLDCDRISRESWHFCIHHNIWLTCSHIPGVENEADKPSRVFKDHIEWELVVRYFNRICEKYGKPDIDLFATRLNKKVKKFCSWYPDPDACYINAFSLNWSDFKFAYSFPPFSLVGRCIQKIQTDRAKGILVVPLWPTQTFFPVLMRLLVDSPLILPKTSSILKLGQSSQEHPLEKQLVMIACKVSGDPLETEAFRGTLPKLSCPHGDRPQNANTKRIYRDGFSSVVDERLITFQFLLMRS